MLNVFANVEIDFGSGRGRLVADGQELVLDVDEPSTLIGVVDRQLLGTLAETFTRVGLTLRVRSGNLLILSAGRGIETGILSRLLHLPGIQLSPRFVVSLLVPADP